MGKFQNQHQKCLAPLIENSLPFELGVSFINKSNFFGLMIQKLFSSCKIILNGTYKI
jgi:hypothetical protein